MQNIGYFAPWSRQNSWADRIAINNIRKANTPQSLAMKQQMIEKEDEKFARKFSTPHTSMYTGVKQVSATISVCCCCFSLLLLVGSRSRWWDVQEFVFVKR